jgi:hypothetical protein
LPLCASRAGVIEAQGQADFCEIGIIRLSLPRGG